jgi:16S rRNA (uracil1498-N3)-methyltransferase
MRIIRSYITEALHVGQELVLSEAASNHLVRVLRLGVNDTCVLFNGDGVDYLAKIISVAKRGASVEITGSHAVTNESPVHITLVQGIARGEKMDWILQKATELGVHRIVPVITDRTEVKIDSERSDKKMHHWLGVVASACEQSGRARLPEIIEPCALSHWLIQDKNSAKFALDPEGKLGFFDLATTQVIAERKSGLGPTAATTFSLSLAIGPEGGFSERDLATLKAGGFQGLRMGPRILRTETAGLAAIAALNVLCGDWK